MNGFMKITPYYNTNIGAYFGIFTTARTNFTGQKVTKQLLESAEFKKALEDITFYVKVTDLDVELNVDVKSYQLYGTGSNEKAGFSHQHSGNAGYTLKCSCISVPWKDGKKSDLAWVTAHFLNKRPVNVIINSDAVPNGVYDISKFDGFKLIRPNVYEFDMELKTYTNISKKLTNKVSVLQSNLKRCKMPKHKVLTTSQIKKGEYTVKKGKKKTKVKIKPNSCVGYLNQVLKNKGCYTTSKGKYTTYKKYNKYFTKYTVTGLKNYGKKWNKKGLKPKVNEKGKLSKAMWNAIKRYQEL